MGLFDRFKKSENDELLLFKANMENIDKLKDNTETPEYYKPNNQEQADEWYIKGVDFGILGKYSRSDSLLR